jgi:hypothetical protein
MVSPYDGTPVSAWPEVTKRLIEQHPLKTKGKKSKSGYYLTVNFQKFSASNKKPRILLIRFGWLDSTDWRGQAAQTGQQASLSWEADNYKLLKIY